MRLTLIAAACVAALPAWAQNASVAAPSQQIIVTGNPLRQADPAAPASVLSEEALATRRSSTLGETLDGLPGVAATGFGPNASRPVIRGQDGDRIRILSNAGASLDASSLSFDHAVPLDPLVIERIEVLRGPAALLYGGSALGGVVNAIDNRIPKSPLGPLSGALELRVGGAARERGLSGLVEGGTEGLAWHADAFTRRTDDLVVPSFQVGGAARDRVINSASDAKGGALGVSRVWQDGYVGASIDTYRNDYGVVVEEDITISMKRDKLALAGEWRALPGPFSSVRAQAAFTDYQHQEIEGTGEVGTTFATKGGDARIEAVQAASTLGSGRLDGAWGLQWERSRFSALGEEAFVPTTRTQQLAVFGLQRWSLGQDFHVSVGLRADQVQVDSDGDADGGTPRFGAAQQRSFHPLNASLAAGWGLGGGWQASASLARSQRAPTSYELYADGVHAATAAYERGNLNQSVESGRQFDLGLAWQGGPHSARLSLFHSRFSNYIALAATGTDFTTDEGDVVPIYAFTGVPARLSGLEAEGRWQAWSQEGQRLTLETQADLVRGERSDTGEPLPRLAPWRLSVAADWQSGPWGLRLDVQHAARQDRVDANDTPTPGWTLAHLRATWTTRLAGHDTVLFARVNNLGNTLATSASAIPTVRALSPLPGRSLAAGVRVAF